MIDPATELREGFPGGTPEAVNEVGFLRRHAVEIGAVAGFATLAGSTGAVLAEGAAAGTFRPAGVEMLVGDVTPGPSASPTVSPTSTETAAPATTSTRPSVRITDISRVGCLANGKSRALKAKITENNAKGKHVMWSIFADGSLTPLVSDTFKMTSNHWIGRVRFHPYPHHRVPAGWQRGELETHNAKKPNGHLLGKVVRLTVPGC